MRKIGKRARDIRGCRDCPLLLRGCLGMEQESYWSFQVIKDPPCFSWEGDEWIYARLTGGGRYRDDDMDDNGVGADRRERNHAGDA